MDGYKWYGNHYLVFGDTSSCFNNTVQEKMELEARQDDGKVWHSISRFKETLVPMGDT